MRKTRTNIDEIVLNDRLEGFKKYFQHNVHLIHYQVPKDIDLNHYFEVMNSRGEQLEKHEIIKARLIEKLDNEDRATFNTLWVNCSEMNVYVQQKYRDDRIFGEDNDSFHVDSFDDLPKIEDNAEKIKISELINNRNGVSSQEDNKIDTFQPIMDFSNFLLIVLKLTRIDENGFDPTSFNLDDKELINEFEDVQIDAQFVKQFGYNLLMAKYFLDNYLIHHSNEDDTIENNPWKLQYWQINE